MHETSCNIHRANATKITVLPACCFAPLQWYIVLMRESPVLIDIHEHYPKQTYRNRYDICHSQGRMTLTVPVVGQQGIKTAVKDIRLENGHWRRQHLATLRSAYGKSAFYIHLEEGLTQLFTDTSLHFLLDFNQRGFQLLQPFFAPLLLPWSETMHYIAPDTSIIDRRDNWKAHNIEKIRLLPYPQVFSDRSAFHHNLSILDAVMNLGPAVTDYLRTS